MRKVLFILLLIVNGLHAQSYAPFNSNVTKRFYNVMSSSDNDHFFYADSVAVSGTNTTFYQYFPMQAASPPIDVLPPCYMWGGGGYTIADTTWLGVTINYDSGSEILELYNLLGDTLRFDFSLNLGDSAIFYTGGADEYYIKFTSLQNESIYTSMDTVKTFTILHFDTAGTVINSFLHGTPIKLGKELGLLSFINVSEFPGTEQAFNLQGQLYPLLGSYQLTYEELYPFHIGDTLQFTGEINRDHWDMCKFQISYVVTNRTETPADVTITFNQVVDWIYQVPPPYNSVCYLLAPYGTSMTYAKSTDFLGQPYNRIDFNTWPPQYWSDQYQTYYPTGCSNPNGYYRDESSEMYCDSCRCLTGYDGFGTYFTDLLHTPGLGLTHMYGWMYMSTFNYDTWRLTYYHINGVSCGDYHSIGIETFDEISFVMSPNPTSGLVQLDHEFEAIQVYSLNGQLLQTFMNPGMTFDISVLNAGIYVVDFITDDIHIRRKIIKTD